MAKVHECKYGKYVIKPRPEGETRAYWRKRIPDNTPIWMCKKEINRLLGCDLEVLIQTPAKRRDIDG